MSMPGSPRVDKSEQGRSQSVGVSGFSDRHFPRLQTLVDKAVMASVEASRPDDRERVLLMF